MSNHREVPMIRVSIDSNEAMRPRAELIRKAIASDDHFEEAPERRRLISDLSERTHAKILKR